jgi:hypothetical protein
MSDTTHAPRFENRTDMDALLAEILSLISAAASTFGW